MESTDCISSSVCIRDGVGGPHLVLIEFSEADSLASARWNKILF